MQYENNKGADQPAHSSSRISTFVVHCLDSVIPILSKAKIPRLQQASVAEQAGLSLTWSQTLEDRFSREAAHMYYSHSTNHRLPWKRYAFMTQMSLFLGT